MGSAAPACCAALFAVPAEAAPCTDLDNFVVLQVGDTQEPLAKQLGRKLADDAEPITLVYVTSGSCTNIEAIYTDLSVTTTPKFVPSSNDDPSWDPSMPSPECELPVDGSGLPIDLANSATFVSSCTTDDPPAGIGFVSGPVQGYLFVVPEASSQTALTAEEGYFAFGFGEAGQVTPWVNEELLFIRPPTKSTILTTMAALDVPAAKAKGVPYDKSGELVAAMQASPDPEASIGILGVEIYDRNRDTLNALAFQAFGQNHAYYPDSTFSATDKQNVRDGHYVPWAPTVFLGEVDEAGSFVDDRVARIVGMILGEDVQPPPDPPFDPLALVIGVGLIPDCAMKVTRKFEGGDLSLYDPATPCDCYFLSEVGGDVDACVACEGDEDCDGGACHHGFCEAY